MIVCRYQLLPQNDHADLSITTADIGNPDMPEDISFSKGEIMDIIDKTDDWWKVRKEDGTLGGSWSLHPP